MRRIVARAFLAALAAAAVAVMLAPAASSKSYDFPRVRIDATVMPDGSLLLVERRTFAFRGRFSNAEFTIDWPSDLIEDLTVSEGGERVAAQVVGDDTSTTATWHYSARNERRTWTIRYRAECAVRTYRDAAHLLWRFVGRWGVPTNLVEVTIHLPEVARHVGQRPSTCPPRDLSTLWPTRPLREREVRAWGHGPLDGVVAIPRPDTVTLTVRGLRGDQYVEGSVLAPPEIVPAARASDRRAYDRILQVERRLADRANDARDRAEARAERGAERREAERRAALEQERRDRDAANRSSWIVAIGALVAGAALVLLARRRDRVSGLPEVVREPPEAVHPVSLAIRWHAYRRVPGTKPAYRAQLLHLASEGIIELRATGSVSDPDDLTIRLRRRPDDDGPDRDFVTFLFPDDEHDDAPVSLAALRTGGTDGVVLRRWWTNALHGAAGALDRIHRGRVRLETVVAALVGITVAVRGLVALLADGAEAGAAAIAAGLVTWLGVARFVPPRLGAQEREAFARWAGFRRYLRDFSNLHEAPTMAVTIWQHYLVWAVALDIADEVEKQVRALVPPEAMPAPWPGGPAGLDALRWGTLSSVHVPSFAGSWLALSGGGWGGGSVLALSLIHI